MSVNFDALIRQLGMVEGKKGKYPFKEARLFDAGGDLSKQWVVVYYVFDEQAEKLVRKRVRIEGKTVEERNRKAATYIKGINKLLASGYYINAQKVAAPAATLAEYLPEPAPAKAPKEKPMTFLEFYRRIKKKELRIDTTMDLYDLYLRQFGKFLEEKNIKKILLRNITSKMAHEFFDNADVGARYYNNMLGFLKASLPSL